jgi:hypothetical protein
VSPLALGEGILRTAMVALWITVCTVDIAFACQCLPPPEPLEALERADFVLSGTAVVRINGFDRLTQDGSKRPPDIMFSDDLVGWAIAVDSVWKGAACDTVVVYTAASGASCGYSFLQGARYLLYGGMVEISSLANRYDVESAAVAEIRMVGLCSRTKPIGQAEIDLQVLPEPRSPCETYYDDQSRFLVQDNGYSATAAGVVAELTLLHQSIKDVPRHYTACDSSQIEDEITVLTAPTPDPWSVYLGSAIMVVNRPSSGLEIRVFRIDGEPLARLKFGQLIRGKYMFELRCNGIRPREVDYAVYLNGDFKCKRRTGLRK